jgi:hypothetical protein
MEIPRDQTADQPARPWRSGRTANRLLTDMRTGNDQPVDRASDADLAFLAMDGEGGAEQFGSALVLDGGIDECIVADRIARVPRYGNV